MSEQSPARKRSRSEDSSEDGLSKKPKLQAFSSGLQCGTRLQLSIDEGIRQLCAYQSDLRRGCVASKGTILDLLDAMRAEIIGSAGSDRRSLRLILPDEVVLDVFVYLDRLRLDKLQYACRRFRTIVDVHMTDFCYRVIACVNIKDRTVTAWIGNRGRGGMLEGTPLLSSDVSEHGERRAIVATKLSFYEDHITDVLSNVCRNANVLVYKISNETLYMAGLDLNRWPKLVPENADRVTVFEFDLDRCTVYAPRDGSIQVETTVMSMLERFRRVHTIRLSFDFKSFHREDDRHDVFTDRFLEFAAAHEIGSVDLPNWDKGISEQGVISFLLDAPSDRSKRELTLGGAENLTARFYDALVKVRQV